MSEDERREAIRKRVSIALKAVQGLPIEHLLLLKAAIGLEISLQQPTVPNDRNELVAAYWRELYKGSHHESTRKTA